MWIRSIVWNVPFLLKIPHQSRKDIHCCFITWKEQYRSMYDKMVLRQDSWKVLEMIKSLNFPKLFVWILLQRYEEFRTWSDWRANRFYRGFINVFSRRARLRELKFFHSRLCKQVAKIIITAGQFAVLATLSFIFELKQASHMDFRWQSMLTKQTTPVFYCILVLRMQTQTWRELGFLVWGEFMNCTD